MARDSKREISRRQFILRSAKAGLSIVGAGCVGYFLYDPEGPDASIATSEIVKIPDFSIAGKKPEMCIAQGQDRAETLKRAVKAMGGMESFISKGDRVLLKVNAAFASPPALSATTHPQLVSAVTRLCLEAGASSVVVTDNPINDPSSCFALTGIAEAARKAGARVFIPEKEHFKPVTLEKGQLIRNWPVLHAPFKGINKLIGLAPVKDHSRSGASMTMKNWYGLLGGRRNIFHQDIHNIIKELAMMVKPSLVILDGITTMMTNGPTGGSLSDIKQTDTLIVSNDQVAADAFGATLLGRKSRDLPYIIKAEALGLGTANYMSLAPKYVSAGRSG
ncbi:DUF362 domain-containing protein [Thermodesulfobacteriota bacterium]